MLKSIVIGLFLTALLAPILTAAMPIECEYAAETQKWGDWLWCGIVLVVRGFMQEGPTDAGMPLAG